MWVAVAMGALVLSIVGPSLAEEATVDDLHGQDLICADADAPAIIPDDAAARELPTPEPPAQIQSQVPTPALPVSITIENPPTADLLHTAQAPATCPGNRIPGSTLLLFSNGVTIRVAGLGRVDTTSEPGKITVYMFPDTKTP